MRFNFRTGVLHGVMHLLPKPRFLSVISTKDPNFYVYYVWIIGIVCSLTCRFMSTKIVRRLIGTQKAAFAPQYFLIAVLSDQA